MKKTIVKIDVKATAIQVDENHLNEIREKKITDLMPRFEADSEEKKSTEGSFVSINGLFEEAPFEDLLKKKIEEMDDEGTGFRDTMLGKPEEFSKFFEEFLWRWSMDNITANFSGSEPKSFDEIFDMTIEDLKVEG